MKLSTFINRPVLSTVISIFIVIFGLIGLMGLPIEQFPDIAPPTIRVSTTYTGANAQSVLNSVIAPLEEQINGAENMTYMFSQAANNGSATITVYFKQGTDPDMAAVDVQNRVAKAASFLPQEVNQVGVITQKQQSSMLVVFDIYADHDQYSVDFIENYMAINIIPVIKRVQGVGDAMVMGADYSMRVWLKPDVMAQYGLMPTDISAALAEQNVEAAPGQFGEQGNQSFQYVMRTKGRLVTEKEFEDIIIRALPNGEMLRLKDVADVELGRLSYGFQARNNGHRGCAALVFQSPGSNATQVVNNIQKELDRFQKECPKGLVISTSLSVNDFLFASIHEVIKTLIEAFVLVFIVVFIFLQDFRSTIIPMIAIPVALIGTFFLLYIFGFTINLLTLSALVLAIAIVVDDAIVVVEAVHAKLDEGYQSARKASIDAMNEIASALISITLVMMLVFIPVSFMGGTSGVFYRQFGLTMAMAIGLSALNALTLSPALCAVFLKPKHADGTTAPLKERIKDSYAVAGQVVAQTYKKRLGFHFPPIVTMLLLVAAIAFLVMGWYTFENVMLSILAYVVAILAIIGMFQKAFIDAFNKVFEKILGGYKKCTQFFINHKLLGFGLIGGVFALLVWLMSITATSLVPDEDTGTIMGALNMPPGTSMERTLEVMNQVDSIASTIPEIKTRTAITGYSFVGGQGSTYGSFIIKLKHWDERKGDNSTADAVLGKLFMQCGQIKDARIMFFKPPMISGYSATSGFEIKIQDKTGGDLDKFFQVYMKFLQALNARPEISMAYSTFNPTFPMYLVDIDIAKVKKAGLTQSAVLSALQGYYGGMYVSNFNRFGKLYRVMMQATPDARVSPETLKQVKVRNGSEMAPIDNFVKLTRVYGPDVINRFNMFTAIAVTGNPAPGTSSGEAIAAIEEVAAQTLPQGYGYEYSGLTREEAQSGSGSTAYVFGLVLLFVYLLLSAQYESYLLPWAVILSVPLGLIGTFVFAHLMGIDNNIYLQIALIMLIGLLAKNAILIVEFAAERRQTGMSIVNSAIAGATARLRPILMTSLAMIIGLLPLMFATGAGANGYRALGTGAIGGMLIGMVLQVLLVPMLYVVFQKIQEKITPLKWKDTDNSGLDSELEQYATNPSNNQ
ncbi:MAG: efflux RND transporter permease subunit [Clostridium sp.]|nr:efflux RND transporter permease subunit [Prevotella sp.]MCM1429330.1 efflux RND transporter permease subunit [Clostridium sp.]MCM1475636.1 efflux RND transporter permease subunit [Muribaculaceae bacterium]